MKIDNQKIVSAARELRDKENERLHVRPWNRRRRFRVPAWLVAVPAAAVVGFAFGVWTTRQSPQTPLTALVDTVYVPVTDDRAQSPKNSGDASPMPDMEQAVSSPQPSPVVRRAKTTRAVRREPDAPTGQPIISDKIRYDLLVNN